MNKKRDNHRRRQGEAWRGNASPDSVSSNVTYKSSLMQVEAVRGTPLILS